MQPKDPHMSRSIISRSTFLSRLMSSLAKELPTGDEKQTKSPTANVGEHGVKCLPMGCLGFSFIYPNWLCFFIPNGVLSEGFVHVLFTGPPGSLTSTASFSRPTRCFQECAKPMTRSAMRFLIRSKSPQQETLRF